MADFVVIFKVNFARHRFCADQTSIFDIVLTEVIIILLFQQQSLQKWQMAKPSTSWLVPTFWQLNLCLVVSGHCLHISVTKFQDKFASLWQGNSPYHWNKFQICCTDMYLIRFLPNFVVFFVFLWISLDFADLPEFHGSSTVRNIRSPVYWWSISLHSEFY